MPGVVFLICIPTSNYEKELEFGTIYDNNETPAQTTATNPHNLNILQPESNLGVLRLEVELRDKNVRPKRFPASVLPKPPQKVATASPNPNTFIRQNVFTPNQLSGEMINNCMTSMEKILEELLVKLNIPNVIWSRDKSGHFYQVVFPLSSGDPCETTLHCLTELGIGTKRASSVSVLPCSVTYDSSDKEVDQEYGQSIEQSKKWAAFVDSIKSKLTVKQVVDGVRAGGTLSFDYILLIVTADSLAALGLVENNAPNIVAAMLVSPLMGPVMSITFAAIISDRDLMRSGVITLLVGIFISICFGFIFGLILGTTEMPWGFGDWPTEEMKGRGNYRSVWMGVLWALTSGTGVAVALLQGSVGPLIGVAISASLLPPVVNCGLFWALACIWLIYDGVKMPHLKGEAYTGNSSYEPIYSNYVPLEFFVNGLISACLTFVNVICIFITAIILLKIKEVAAPYTASPDLRRFWETDISAVRKTNRSTLRRKNVNQKMSPYEDLSADPHNKNLESALEQALKEAVDDETFRKVKRMSYSNNAVEEVIRGFPLTGSGSSSHGPIHIDASSVNTNISKEDLAVLDKLVTTLLKQHQTDSPILSRLHKPSRLGSLKRSSADLQPSTMPTIPETSAKRSSWTERNIPSVQHVLNTIKNAPNRLSQSLMGGGGGDTEDNINLTENYLG